MNSCLALGLVWVPGNCIVFGQLSINEGETLTIANIILQVQPSGAIDNSGTINNSGTITNFGNILNREIFNNSGTIQNRDSGTINNDFTSIFNNHVIINNEGAADIDVTVTVPAATKSTTATELFSGAAITITQAPGARFSLNLAATDAAIVMLQ